MSILDQYFVFHPEPWQDRDWARLSGLPLEDVWFQAADGVRLFGWYVEAQADRPVILWCHGNAGNVIHRLEKETCAPDKRLLNGPFFLIIVDRIDSDSDHSPCQACFSKSQGIA